MKYFVDIDGRQVLVEVDADRVTVEGSAHHATLQPLSGTPLQLLLVDGRPRRLAAQSLGRGRWTLMVGGERYEVEVMDERTRHIRSLAATPDRQAGGGVLKAPMPGLVVRVEVAVGQVVAAGVGVLVLEAMKMENELRAPAGGTVRAVRVQPGQAVERGQPLVEFE